MLGRTIFYNLQFKVVLNLLPALEVLLVQLVAGLLSPLGNSQLETALEHEGLCPLRHLDRPQALVGPVLEALGVRSVGRHHGVEGGTAGTEALLLGLVLAQDEAHELGHAVPVVVRRPERLLS